MGRAKPPFTERRVLAKHEVASYIGKSTSWFEEHAEELYASGFPKQLSLLLGYDRAAVDQWIDGLGGSAAPAVGNHNAAWEKASGCG